MTARHKLNAAYLSAILLLAAVIGTMAGSWVVFFIASAVLVGLSLHAGSIRLAMCIRTGTGARPPTELAAESALDAVYRTLAWGGLSGLGIRSSALSVALRRSERTSAAGLPPVDR